MAFSRDRKKNPSSRYSRMEEPWLDDRGKRDEWDNSADPRDEGFGVRDSYSRQASYGRPDGYYDSYRPAGGMGDTRVYSSEVTNAARQSASAQGRGTSADRRGASGGRRSASADRRREAYRPRRTREEARESYYDDWDDPEYDDRYARPGRRGDERYEERYDSRSDDRYDERYDDRYDEREEENYDRRRRPAGHGRRSAPGRGEREGSSKTGFIIKLILLLIATAALVVVWRFSRMDHMNLKDILTNSGVSGYSGYQDFVIYGVDSREGSLTRDAHSDTIILCSMNKNAKEIRLVSVYRDTYLDNTNGEYRKATECYFFGGPERSVNMLNKNLDLNLKDYVTVDFNAVVKAVDLIGGVDVDVTEEELPYINGYQTENAQVTGAEITPVTSAGYQHLNGIQALAYCRIRYTAGSDYKRTERQRTVLTQIFQNAKQQGPVKLAQIVDAMIPSISTSFSSTELLALASSVSEYSLTETGGFPFDLQAANISAGDCVVPVNLAQNVSQLHTFLYGQTGYTPSETVQQISQQIAAATGIY